MCLGYFDNKRNQEYIHRKMWYAIVQGWADHKKLPKIEQAWPIQGEKIIVPKRHTKKDVDLAIHAMRNFWKNRKKLVN